MITRAKGGGGRTPDYTPTPEEIRQACAEIRQGWSEEMHYHRATGIPLSQVAERRAWTAPLISASDLGLADAPGDWVE